MRFQLLMPIVALAAISLPHPARSASEETRIILKWTATYDRLEPKPKRVSVDWEKTLVLSGAKTVREITNRSSGRKSKSEESTKEFGDVGDRGGGWRILGGNTFQRVSVLKNSVRTLTIRIEGQRSCSLEVSYRLNPGQTELLLEMMSRPGVIGRYTKPVITGTDCRVELPSSI